MNTVDVQLGDRSYSILIGSGILASVGEMLKEVVPSESYFFVIDANVESTHGKVAMGSLVAEACIVEAIEKNKTAQTLEDIWSSMMASGCERGTPVVTVGGGIVGDVGGFAASTYMRGVPYVQVPTTLLAMVDASIGGKTGINLPLPNQSGILGKNMAGAFWQPRLVVADVDALQTLDDRQLRCGLAECVKHAMLGHNDLLDWIKKHVSAIFARDAGILVELVTRCAEIKADVVAADEREAGSRALLNLGHTFAHAIEPLPEQALFHGEAVSIGICAAMSCSEAMGLFPAEKADQLREVFTTIGLPTRLPLPVSVGELIAGMQADKKTVNSMLRLILPVVGGAEIVSGIDEGVLSLAWASVGASVS
ncbi:MAG: 3-dehydroquinate synthase [Phycisphaerae bacterium]|nr:3-dehydroquinate synthase [Phycisphaerae bacterium]